MAIGSPRRRLLVAAAFLLPNLLGFVAFTAGPLFGSLWMSFTDLSLTKHNEYSQTPVQFVAFANYAAILSGAESERFWSYLGNTLYLMIGIPLGIAGSLGLALLITAKLTPTRQASRLKLAAVAAAIGVCATLAVWILTSPEVVSADDTTITSAYADLSAYEVARLRGLAATLAMALVSGLAVAGVAFGSVFFRTAFYLPSLLAGVPMFLLWKTLYRPEGGLVNATLRPAVDVAFEMGQIIPEMAWQGTAIGLWLAVGVVVVRGLAAGVQKLVERDAGAAAFIARIFMLGTLAAVALGLGVVCWELPAHAAASISDGRSGFDTPEWLVSATWAKPALVIMGVWLGVGGANMLLYIAGLSNIPPELYEAADIDGAAGWQRFVNVTWPQLAPTTFFIVIMSTIGGLQGGFEQALIMTGGLYDTTVLTYYIYNLAFTDQFQLGMASAVAWVMFAMIFAMTLVNYRLGNGMTNE